MRESEPGVDSLVSMVTKYHCQKCINLVGMGLAERFLKCYYLIAR